MLKSIFVLTHTRRLVSLPLNLSQTCELQVLFDMLLTTALPTYLKLPLHQVPSGLEIDKSHLEVDPRVECQQNTGARTHCIVRLRVRPSKSSDPDLR